MNNKIKEQILAIRATGHTNMFDVNAVQVIANDMGFMSWYVSLKKTRVNIQSSF